MSPSGPKQKKSLDALVLLKGMPWGQVLLGQNVGQEPLSAGEAMAGWVFPCRDLGEIFIKYNVKTMVQGENILIISFS